MPLDLTTLKERLEKKPKRAQISRASSFDERVKFLVEPALVERDSQRQRTLFIEWCKSLLHKDALPRFEALLKPPYDTVALFDRVYDALSKVFDGKDSVYRAEFSSDTAKEDWANYQAEVLDEPYAFKKAAFEKLRSGINAFIVVDMASEVSSPDPYYYFVDMASVVDYEYEGNELMWLVYKMDEEHLVTVDTERYVVYHMPNKSYSKLIEKVNNPHDLGYCPARRFYPELVDDSVSRHPAISYLSLAAWFLFMATAKKYLDTYASTPIFWGYDPECEYEYDGQHCEGGYLYTEDNSAILVGAEPKACPACQNKKLGPGGFITVPQPDEEIADMRNPIGVIDIPINGVKYSVEELERLKNEILEGITGQGAETDNKQAFNIEQVLASIDARKTIIVKIKTVIEQTQEWLVSTICRLRYGSAFSYAYVNLGTQFHWFEPEQVLELYNKAKAENSDDIILDQLQDEYFDAKYRTSPEDRLRTRILLNLDPFRHRTREEVMEMPVNEELKLLKANFSSLIQRFERENINVVTFGEALEFDRKINSINAVLMGYVQELKVENGELQSA